MKKDILFEAIKAFGEEYISELAKELMRLDKKASGDLLRSLNSRAYKTAMGTQYTIKIVAEDYLKYVDEGRKPGKFVPVQALSRWAEFKGIPQQFVYPINYNIYRFGIKPTNVIQKSLNKINLSRKAESLLEDGALSWAESLIEDMVKRISDKGNIVFS